MQSRTGRLTICTLIWLAFAASGGFIYYTEQHLAARRTMLRAFDVHFHEALHALADVRAGQEAYVAAGQGMDFWLPKVSGLISTVTTAVENARESAASAAGVAALEEAATTVNDFSDVDKRAREYLKTNQSLMASDVVFTEGGGTASNAARQVQAASVAEHDAFAAFEGNERRFELAMLAGSGALGAFGALLLAISGAKHEESGEAISIAPPQPAPAPPRIETPALKAAANLCTEFGRVKDLADLTKLLGQAAEAMDASGLIVWLGSAGGADLRPVLTHGYPQQMLAKMPSVPRNADNAAAAAYRTGSLQLVLARPGTSSGAIVAPLLSPEGTVGALTAEMHSGSETSANAQSLAAIFAAQLSGVLGASAAEAAPAQKAAGA